MTEPIAHDIFFLSSEWRLLAVGDHDERQNMQRQLSATRRRWRYPLASAIATLALLPLATSPAAAHNSERSRFGVVAAASNVCVTGDDKQDHGLYWGGNRLSRSIRTFANISTGSSCAGTASAGYGNLRQKGEVYKAPREGMAGTPCVVGGYQYNELYTFEVSWWTNEDMWHLPCNYGAGNNVFITHDMWHAVRTNGYWLEGAWRPATGHCHCP